SFTSSTQRLNISSKLINRRQGVNESVQSYYYDILQLCKRFNHMMTESEQIIHLLRGLKPSIQHHVIINDLKQCTDLLEQAKRMEAATTLTQPTVTPTTETMEESTTAALRRTNNTQNFRRDEYYNRNYPRYSNYDRRWPQQQNSVTYQQSPYSDSS
ncbi:unnamed protein product, partial [Didymodactylos carnosus]